MVDGLLRCSRWGGVTLNAIIWPAPPTRDNFDSPTLGLPWNFRGNPSPAHWPLTNRPGRLQLVCAEDDLNAPMLKSFVGRRQEHLECEVSTSLKLLPTRSGEEAGLVVFINERHHYEIFVTDGTVAGDRKVNVWRRIRDLTAIVASTTFSNMAVTLSIVATEDRYVFAWFDYKEPDA